MKTCFRIRDLAFLVILGIWGTPVLAWQPPTVNAISCELRHEIFGAPSPTPNYCYWTFDPQNAPWFDATTVDGYGNYCVDDWRVFCHADSLGYRGSWNVETLPLIRSVAYDLDMIGDLIITESTRLLAERSVTDSLVTSVHSVTLGLPDGGEQVLLAEGEGVDQAGLVLVPGVYQVRVHVAARRYDMEAAYLGRIDVTWTDPSQVAIDPVSWSTVKARYLR